MRLLDIHAIFVFAYEHIHANAQQRTRTICIITNTYSFIRPFNFDKDHVYEYVIRITYLFIFFIYLSCFLPNNRSSFKCVRFLSNDSYFRYGRDRIRHENEIPTSIAIIWTFHIYFQLILFSMMGPMEIKCHEVFAIPPAL